MIIGLMDETSDDFDKAKASSHMIKSDAEDSYDVLKAIVENLEIKTNLSSKIRHYKRKDIAEIFNEKVFVGSQKTRVTLKVERIKNTKNTFKFSYNIELPNRPIFALFVLMGLFLGIIGAFIIYAMFSHSDAKKIQMIYPVKTMLHDAISDLETVT